MELNVRHIMNFFSVEAHSLNRLLCWKWPRRESVYLKLHYAHLGKEVIVTPDFIVRASVGSKEILSKKILKQSYFHLCSSLMKAKLEQKARHQQLSLPLVIRQLKCFNYCTNLISSLMQSDATLLYWPQRIVQRWMLPTRQRKMRIVCFRDALTGEQTNNVLHSTHSHSNGLWTFVAQISPIFQHTSKNNAHIFAPSKQQPLNDVDLHS